MSADLVSPRVGCGAAILDSGRLLLVHRRREPEAGSWGLPGGKVEPFEAVAAAVVREIAEELGIVVEATELLCVVDQIDRAAGEHWVAPVFRVDRYEGMPSIKEPEALSDWGWFDVNTMPAPITQATAQAVAALMRQSRGV